MDDRSAHRGELVFLFSGEFRGAGAPRQQERARDEDRLDARFVFSAEQNVPSLEG